MDFKFHMIGLVLFFMMELLPMSARSVGIQRIIKKSLSSCVSGKWVKVGRLRFWKRVSCPKRRQGVDYLDQMPSTEDGPKRTAHYDPTYGYEPYWADGDWVFDRKVVDPNNTLYMCNSRCPTMYYQYGKVCARNKNLEYQTFENYCALKSYDCSGIDKWTLLYRGNCYRERSPYEHKNVHNRAGLYISSFMLTYTSYHSYVGFYSKKPGKP